MKYAVVQQDDQGQCSAVMDQPDTNTACIQYLKDKRGAGRILRIVDF